MSVDPDAQGLGFCGKLMRAVNVWADNLQLPLWLETSGARNVAIYERCHGWVMFYVMFYFMFVQTSFPELPSFGIFGESFWGHFFPRPHPRPLLVFNPTGLVTKLWSSTPWNAKKDPEVHEDEFGMMRSPVKASEWLAATLRKNSATGDVVICACHV